MQRKQFSETIVASHDFQQISDLKIFPECFRGPLQTLWRATCGRGPVVGPHWFSQLTEEWCVILFFLVTLCYKYKGNCYVIVASNWSSSRLILAHWRGLPIWLFWGQILKLWLKKARQNLSFFNRKGLALAKHCLSCIFIAIWTTCLK